MAKIYTGIGSRDTPEDVLLLMKKIGFFLAQEGYTLYSGGAGGADFAFEQGCDLAQGSKKIFVPWKNFGKKHGRVPQPTDICGTPALAKQIFKELVAEYQDFSPLAKDYIWALMERNMCQILGPDMKTPTSNVICWTPGAEDVGGTRWALRLARREGVSIRNLADDNERRKLEALVQDIHLPTAA